MFHTLQNIFGNPTSRPQAGQNSSSRVLRIINSLWTLYILLTAGKTYRSCKLSYLVSLKKLIFAMTIISFILWNVFLESNIELAMDRFPKAIPWSGGWEYQQVSWLSSHSNESIRRESFSAVLVIYAGFLHSWQKLGSILKKTVIRCISF